MTKADAIKKLILDYHNNLIASDFDCLTDLDYEICKALKIKIPNEEDL